MKDSCDKCGQPHPYCNAHKVSTGRPCMRPPNKGGTVCRNHGGGNLKRIAQDALVHEVRNWGLGDANIDPGETLLRLLTQSVRRANDYAYTLSEMVQEHGLHDALVGDRMVMSESGKLTKIDEYVKGLARLEADERDRAGGFAAKAIAAGLAERQVRIAERLGDQLAEMLRAIFDDLDLTDAQRDAVPTVLDRHLMLAE